MTLRRTLLVSLFLIPGASIALLIWQLWAWTFGIGSISADAVGLHLVIGLLGSLGAGFAVFMWWHEGDDREETE